VLPAARPPGRRVCCGARRGGRPGGWGGWGAGGGGGVALTPDCPTPRSRAPSGRPTQRGRPEGDAHLSWNAHLRWEILNWRMAAHQAGGPGIRDLLKKSPDLDCQTPGWPEFWHQMPQNPKNPKSQSWLKIDPKNKCHQKKNTTIELVTLWKCYGPKDGAVWVIFVFH